MAAVKEVHVGDVGTKFTANLKDDGVAVDLTGAITLTLRFMRPNRSRFEKMASVVGADTDGVIQYTTVANDISNDPGTWNWQPYIELPSGSWSADWKPFHVEANI